MELGKQFSLEKIWICILVKMYSQGVSYSVLSCFYFIKKLLQWSVSLFYLPKEEWGVRGKEMRHVPCKILKKFLTCKENCRNHSDYLSHLLFSITLETILRTGPSQICRQSDAPRRSISFLDSSILPSLSGPADHWEYRPSVRWTFLKGFSIILSWCACVNLRTGLYRL